MIKTYLFLSGTMQTGGPELIDLWRKEPASMIWIDLSDHEKLAEAKLLQTDFGLHSLAIQDAQRDRHPPKIEAFDDYTFILLKDLLTDTNNIDFKTLQLALFLGERFLVTRHMGQSKSINRLEEILAEQKMDSFSSVSKLAMRLCRLAADQYLNILLVLEPRLEEIEEQMLDNANDSLLAELIKYKGALKRLIRFATYHERIFSGLKDKAYPGFSEAVPRHEAVDVWEQQERAHSLSQLYYENASDLIDGYISIASHRLNQIMKVLTIVMAIFVPLSFLAGIYGMNFEYMPELHSKSGYFILLTIMGSIAFLLLIGFRRLKWL